MGGPGGGGGRRHHDDGVLGEGAAQRAGRGGLRAGPQGRGLGVERWVVHPQGQVKVSTYALQYGILCFDESSLTWLPKEIGPEISTRFPKLSGMQLGVH